MPHGKTIGDSDEQTIDLLFNTAFATHEQEKKNAQTKRNMQIGADILGCSQRVPIEYMSGKDAEAQLSRRDLWIWRLTHNLEAGMDPSAEEL